MIWRNWILLLLVFVGGAWLLAVPYSPAPQVKTASVIGIYRAMDLVPEAGRMTMSPDVGHDVFAVPEADAEYRKAAMAGGGMAMPGHGKGGMAMPPADRGATATPPVDRGAMKMGDGDKGGMPAMEMGKPAGDGAKQADVDHGRGGAEAGLTIVAAGAGEVAKFYAGGGTATKATIDMREWGFDSSMVMAKAGEAVHLVVRNTGSVPHEFMLMDQVGMAAVDYRLGRADWNLLEHVSAFEMPVLMPGDGVELIVKLEKSGMWMYMCMFPYHMQLGMMGMLMTPDMMGKGGMRM